MCEEYKAKLAQHTGETPSQSQVASLTQVASSPRHNASQRRHSGADAMSRDLSQVASLTAPPPAPREASGKAAKQEERLVREASSADGAGSGKGSAAAAAAAASGRSPQRLVTSARTQSGNAPASGGSASGGSAAEQAGAPHA